MNFPGEKIIFAGHSKSVSEKALNTKKNQQSLVIFVCFIYLKITGLFIDSMQVEENYPLKDLDAYFKTIRIICRIK